MQHRWAQFILIPASDRAAPFKLRVRLLRIEYGEQHIARSQSFGSLSLARTNFAIALFQEWQRSLFLFCGTRLPQICARLV